MRTIILTLAFAFSACATVPPVPVDVYPAACSNLAQLGCPEGARPNCAAVMKRAEDEHLTDTKAQCLAGAKSAEEARACGSVRCAK
jgi:hypothetical protein